MENKENSLIFSQKLNSAGLRVTPQRLAIYALLAHTKTHPTAQMIFEELRPQYPSLSLATVYNTLQTLTDLGVIHALGSAGDDAIHYDADISSHVNLACLSCHRVIDVFSAQVNDLKTEIASSTGYLIKGERILYYGICPDCQGKAPPSTE